MEDGGWFIDWHADLSEHLELTYKALLQSAVDADCNSLAVDYARTVEGIQSGDFGWYARADL